MKVLGSFGVGVALVAAAAAVAVAARGNSAGERVPTVTAQEAHEAHSTGATITPAEALAADSASYAADHGTTVDEARERLSGQAAAGDLLARLEERFPQSFAGGWIEHDPALRAVATFTGAVPEEAARLAASSRVDVRLAGGAERSLAELRSRADAVHTDVAAEWSTSVTTAFDVATGTVEVAVEVPADLRGLSTEELRSRLPESARGEDVRVAFADAPVAGGEHTRGGAKTPYDGGSGYCTTGFSVAKSGTYGFVTAGHCYNDRSYKQPEDGLTYNAPYKAQHRGDWGDFQWHTTPHVEYAEFYTTSTGHRDVLGYDGSLSAGDYLCKYGRTSGYGCSTVYKTSVSVTYDGITHKRLVAMKDYITSGGDSGGPWFIVNDAVGVHAGWVSLDGSKRSMFSRIVYIDDALGLALVVK